MLRRALQSPYVGGALAALFVAVTLASFSIAGSAMFSLGAPRDLDSFGRLNTQAQDGGSKPSPASCCSNIDKKPLRQLNLAETLEWLQCNQIAADSIEIVRREKVVGYEMSLMSQDELMELLAMTKIHAWRVSRCKDVTDGTRRWAGGQQQGAKVQSTQQQTQKPSAPSGGQQTRRAGSACRFGEDMTGKRCFGLTRAPDPAWTPASCKDQCCRRSEECGLWLYSYAEGCWIGKPGQEYNCRDEAGWFGGKGII